MPVVRQTALFSRTRAASAVVLAALAVVASGCGSGEVQTNSTSLEKPALTIPQGSVEASASTKKSGSTGSTSSTTSDSTDTSSGTDTGTGGADTGTDTGGADNGTDTGTGNAGTGTDTGGAGPGQ